MTKINKTMDTLYTYILLGLDHILDIKSYDHILFIISITVSYTIKEWKPLLVLVTAFTIGHSTTLALTVIDAISFNSEKIEALIVLSITLTSAINIIRVLINSKYNNVNIYYVIAILFGLIHGMGFASYLKAILVKSGNIITPLLGFNIGLELGQIIIVAILLLLSFLLKNIISLSHRTIIIIFSTVILLQILKMVFAD